MAKHQPNDPRWHSTSTWLAATAVLLPGISLILIGWMVLRIQTGAIHRQIEDETRAVVQSGVDALHAASLAFLERLRSDIQRADTPQIPVDPTRTLDPWFARFERDPVSGAITPLDGPPPTRPLAPPKDSWITEMLPLVEQNARAALDGGEKDRFESLLRGTSSPAERASIYLAMIAALARSNDIAAAIDAQDRLLSEVPSDAEWNGIPLQLACALERLSWSGEPGNEHEASTLWNALADDQIPLPRLTGQAHLRAAIDALRRVDPALERHGSLRAATIAQRERAEREGARFARLAPGEEFLKLDDTAHLELVAGRVTQVGDLAGFASQRAEAILPKPPPDFSLGFAVDGGAKDTESISASAAVPQALGDYTLIASADPTLLAARARPWTIALAMGATMVAIMSLVCAIIAARGVSRRLRYARLRYDLVTSVAHELRTPLTGMMLQLELLEDERIPPEHQRENATRARRAAAHLHRLVERVLSLDRSERAPTTDRRTQVSARALFDEAISTISVVWPDLTIHRDIDDRAPDAWVDPDVIQQVLSGVLDNAARYAGPSAAVSLGAAKGPGKTLQIDVVDDGPGVPGDQTERVFEEFHRLDRDHGVEGNGLGLAIARRLMFNAGGTIHAEHAPSGSSQKGLRIVIRIPTTATNPNKLVGTKNQRALA